MLARYLDGRPDRSAYLGLRDLRAADRYLLYSGGLSPIVSTGAIRDVLVSADATAETVRRAVRHQGALDQVAAQPPRPGMPCRTIVPRRGTVQTRPSASKMATARATVSRFTP